MKHYLGYNTIMNAFTQPACFCFAVSLYLNHNILCFLYAKHMGYNVLLL